VPASARVAIERVVAPYLEERYRDYVARYGFSPKGPVTFELYGEHREFAVRTIGLPTIGVSGVCFGRLITSQSPTNRAFNWGMVLAHELAHVFAIELSRSRVPRWFTEGLSEVETMRARPEWARHDDISLYGAWRRDELPTLVSLSTSFASARTTEESARAYAHAALAVDFLERRFGFPALREALAAYGRGERDPAVLERLARMPAAVLESAFRAELATRFARYRDQYLPTQTWTGPLRAALAAIATGEVPRAQKTVDDLRANPHASDDDRAAATFIAGEIALARKNADAAVEAFSGLLALSPPRDGYDVRVRLALAEIHRRRGGDAEVHLRRAVELDPSRLEPHALLAELYAHDGRAADRLNALAAALRLDPQTDRVAKEVVFGSAKAGRAARVLELAPIAIFIDPADPELHAALGRALAGTNKPVPAAAALEHALALGVRDPVPVHATLAGLYDAIGNRGKADAHRAAARK
jgi:tetratricopeptide (TPR) repeat protein